MMSPKEVRCDEKLHSIKTNKAMTKPAAWLPYPERAATWHSNSGDIIAATALDYFDKNVLYSDACLPLMNVLSPA